MQGSVRGCAVRVSAAVLAVSGLVALGPSALAASPHVAGRMASPPSGAAPGGPGSQSYLDTSRKDCFGTATPTASKVWYTVADGVLSDVYSPTIENTNDGTLQYIVTDGHSFADLQQRDMPYTVSSPTPAAWSAR